MSYDQIESAKRIEQTCNADPHVKTLIALVNGRDLSNGWLAFQHKHYVSLMLVFSFIAPIMTGMMCGLSWGQSVGYVCCVRLVLLYHSTFCINSLDHMWGDRKFDATSSAADSTLCAWLTQGEGYHNFRHTYPKDYRNGPAWYNYDPTKWIIYILQKCGMARNLMTYRRLRNVDTSVSVPVKLGDKRYDIGGFMKHPGGYQLLTQYANKDISHLFEHTTKSGETIHFHSKGARDLLETFAIT